MESQELRRSYIPAFEKVAVLKAYKCSFCNRIYSAQVHANLISGRIPLLMPCSHTVCEECIIHMAKTKDISCKVCHYEMKLESLEALSNIFPVDRFMFGSLMNLNSNVVHRTNAVTDKKVKVLPFSPAGMLKPAGNKKFRMAFPVDEGATSEKELDTCSQTGCSKRAEFRCISCSELYCAKCDKRVHESIRILRNHTRYPIDIADLANFNVTCVTHSNSIGEYSCITCGSMLCSKCVIKDHTGHEVIAIEDKNAQELVPFKDTLQKAKHILRCMEFTQKKVKFEINATRQTQNQDPNIKPSHLVYEIVKHFATLHSRLQLLEQSILEQLGKAQAAKINSLHRLSSELAANIDIMHSLVATGNMVVEGGREHLDKLLLSELEKNITENLILPCELVEENNMKDDNIQFITDQSFMDSLQNHCRIQFEEGLSFKLSPMTDFTERNYEFPADDESVSDCDSTRSRNESEASSTSQISYVKPGCKTRLSLAGNIPTLFTYGETRQTERPKNCNEPIVFNKDTIETVTVTHLRNPSLFYIQLVRKKKHIEELSQKYEIYAEHAATPNKPEIGNTYIVQFTSEKLTKWYRALLKDIHTTGVTILYEVFYIDYGNSAVVPLSKIRVMKPIFMQEAPFAYKCRLNGIISQRNDWTDDVLSYMVQFITAIRDPPLDPVELDSFLIIESSNNSCKMHVIQNQKGILDVDLYSHSESLSAALIFVGYAQPISHIIDMTKKRKIVTLESETKIASANENYRKDQIYKIHVSHIVNPNCIFVQLLSNMKIINNLETAMTRFYNKPDSRKMIFTPEKGMVCVAKVPSSNGNWWRVQIVNLPGGATVEVFSVDYGFTEIIAWNQLCKIRDIHKQTDSQAIRVSLSDISPPKESNGEWDEEANTFLREYLKNKDLSMLVNEPSKEKLMVTIYEHTTETDICVDALLVRKELAQSTGESSLLVEFHKVLPGTNEQSSRRSIGQLIDDEKSQKPEDHSKSMMCGKNFIIEVKILKLNSPGHFYVDIPEWHDEKIKMFKLLAQFYSEQISPAKKWDLQAKCVVRSIKDDKYYRAIITKILEDDIYEVFLKDIVRIEEVPTRNMFELDVTFATHDYSLLCCLGGVKPAGGTGKWSAKSIEVFQEFVENYNRLFITKYGPIVDKILSVQLVTSWEETAGPLEPINTKTLILNEILIQNGLAFKVKVDSDEPIIKDGDNPPPLYPKTEKNQNPAVSSFHKIYNNELVSQSSLTPTSKLLEGDSSLTTDKIPSCQTKPTSWLPPNKFSNTHFKAWASYVDMEGSVYFQTAKSRRLLKNVTRILENHFKHSIPDPPHPWEIGQICTILYHYDKSYCRGTILDITGEKMVVKLIDFGNQEEFSHDELRSEVLATDIPALAVKCRLSNVVPKTKDGSWPVPLLDKLHFTLVDNECEVIIDEREILDSEEELPHLLVYFENECINNLCNNAEWSKKDEKHCRNSCDEEIVIDSDDDKSVVVEEDEVNIDVDVEIAETSVEDIEQTHEKICNSDLRYNYVQLPNDKSSFKAIVINIIDYRSIIVEPEFIAGVMRETSDQFSTMSEEINNCGPKLPVVVSPIVGMPCVALFGDDKKWYRAEILDIMDIKANEIKVLFIDYGNVEIVPRDDVKTIKQEWLIFPVSMMNFKIWGIQKVPDYDTTDVNTAMREAVVDKNVICQIQQYTPKIEVKLIDEETYDLVYKQLLDDKMIENVD